MTSLQHTCSLPYSDDKESLEHDIDKVHIPLESGNPMHTLQAVTNLKTVVPVGQVHVHMQSNTWLTYQLSGEPSVRHCMETFSCWTKRCNHEAHIDKCLVRVLLVDSCWASWTTAELSQ